MWADCLVVLKSSPRKELAAQFINYLLDPHVAARTAEQLLFASANKASRPFVPARILDNPAIYPPLDLLPRLEWMTDVGFERLSQQMVTYNNPTLPFGPSVAAHSATVLHLTVSRRW